jgi:glycosyltransferase involved in cell wall biosynthesis
VLHALLTRAPGRRWGTLAGLDAVRSRKSRSHVVDPDDGAVEGPRHSDVSRPVPKLAILTNQLTPYRIPIFANLARDHALRVFISGAEANRSEWKGIDEQMRSFPVKRSWGFTLTSIRKVGDVAFDHRFLHITPGYIADLARFRPDAVISVEMGFRSIVALLYGVLSRRPVWIWWGGTLHTERARPLIKRLFRWCFARLVPRWISYGVTSTAYLLRIGVKRDWILEIQNCVDERLYSSALRPLLRFEVSPVFLCIGQLIPRKGIDRLLHAAAALQREGRSFSLAIVGSGMEKPALMALAGSLGLRNTTFRDGVPPDIVPQVYASADFLVFPTLEDVWGLVVNEALLSGLPVLCSKYAGAALEIVPPENVFDPLDSHEFVAVLRRALDGDVAPADPKVLLTVDQVADLIRDDISERLRDTRVPH